MSKSVVIGLCLLAVAAAMPDDWTDLGWNAHRSGDIGGESGHLEGNLKVEGHIAAQGQIEGAHGTEVQGTLGASQQGQAHEEHISLFGPQGASGQVGFRDYPREVHNHHYYHEH